jgi:hypothetical protein
MKRNKDRRIAIEYSPNYRIAIIALATHGQVVRHIIRRCSQLQAHYAAAKILKKGQVKVAPNKFWRFIDNNPNFNLSISYMSSSEYDTFHTETNIGQALVTYLVYYRTKVNNSKSIYYEKSKIG